MNTRRPPDPLRRLHDSDRRRDAIRLIQRRARHIDLATQSRSAPEAQIGWGYGRQGALNATKKLDRGTVQQMKANGVTKEVVHDFRDAYEALDQGGLNGQGVADVRVEFMDQI